MKYVRPDGRLLADVGEDLKRRLYKVLFEKNLTFKAWLKDTVKKFVESEEK